jgi:hypothetical protein
MSGYMDISLYYKINFNLVQHHKYNYFDLYDMYPFERDIVVELLNEYIENLDDATA